LTLRDPKVSKLLHRHFVAVAFDIGRVPPPVNALFPRTGGKAMPFIVVMNPRGQYLAGTSGFRNAQQLAADLEKVLGDRTLALPKAREAELTKQVAALEKALAEKKYKQATTAFQAVARARGYSALKDKAHDLLDEAQKDAAKQRDRAVALARQDEYAEAGKLLADMARSVADLPIAAEAREHQSALKLLQAAHKITTDKKGVWKQSAMRQLTLVLTRHPDTPYASLAFQRRKELFKE
jgi:hypothetical protein